MLIKELVVLLLQQRNQDLPVKTQSYNCGCGGAYNIFSIQIEETDAFHPIEGMYDELALVLRSK
jgi:hypothetical protein